MAAVEYLSSGGRRPRTPRVRVMRLVTALGVIAMIVAICCCMLLGTVGWFVMGFGVMTDCTDDYSCSTQSCSPCAGAGRWLEAGAIAQWLLAALGVGLLVRSFHDARVVRLLIGAPVVLLASAITVVGTSSRASESYCQPGTADYSSSYCSTGSRPTEPRSLAGGAVGRVAA